MLGGRQLVPVRTRLSALVALVALAAACSGGGGPETIGRDGAEVVDGADAVTVGAPLDAYEISYRVEETDGDAW